MDDRLYSKSLVTWFNMLRRCLDRVSYGYGRYGGRGIHVCDRWKLFDNFLEDMGLPPSLDASIDRIDPDKGYEKSNCRWIPRQLQGKNTTRNRFGLVNLKKIVDKRYDGNFCSADLSDPEISDLIVGKKVNIWLDGSLYASVKRTSKNKNLSMSDLIRVAVDELISKRTSQA